MNERLSSAVVSRMGAAEIWNSGLRPAKTAAGKVRRDRQALHLKDELGIGDDSDLDAGGGVVALLDAERSNRPADARRASS